MKFVTTALMVIFCLSAYAAPSDPIYRAMNEPASLFDMYLFKVWMHARCDDSTKGYCISGIDYSFSSNTINVTVHAYGGKLHDKLHAVYFEKKTSKAEKESERKAYLYKITSEVAQWMGVSGKYAKYGVYGRVNFWNGWTAKDFNEAETRKEITSRTRLEIFVYGPILKTLSYKTIRRPSGEVIFDEVTY